MLVGYPAYLTCILNFCPHISSAQSVTGIRTLTVFDPCGPSEKTCNTAIFACSFNGNCGSEAAALAKAGSTNSGSAAAAAAAAATALLFSAPDVTPPVITLLGAGQPFVTGTGGSGLITTVIAGSGAYVDAGATALKVLGCTSFD